jgi:hypothetical protein
MYQVYVKEEDKKVCVYHNGHLVAQLKNSSAEFDNYGVRSMLFGYTYDKFSAECLKRFGVQLPERNV